MKSLSDKLKAAPAAPKKRGRPPKAKADQVNWEALSKNLQKALEKEMDEHDETRIKYQHMCARADQIIMVLFKAQGVIEYLKEQNGHNSV